MATNPVKRYWTVEEYLAYEQETGIKHEFIDGEIYSMAGGNDKHSTIKLNLAGELRGQLRQGKDCRGYDSDMRLKISDLRYVYPDMMVVCGEAKFADEKRTMLLNPTLVVEVVSDSSANYDRGDKANYYRGLASVQAYLILEQDKPFAQLYTREENRWILEEYKSLEDIIPLESIGCELAMSEVYLNVEFEGK